MKSILKLNCYSVYCRHILNGFSYSFEYTYNTEFRCKYIVFPLSYKYTTVNIYRTNTICNVKRKSIIYSFYFILMIHFHDLEYQNIINRT